MSLLCIFFSMMGILSDYVSPKNENRSSFWTVIFPNAPGTPDRDHHADGKQNLDMKKNIEPWISKFTLCKNYSTLNRNGAMVEAPLKTTYVHIPSREQTPISPTYQPALLGRWFSGFPVGPGGIC